MVSPTGGDEGITALGQDLHQVVSEVTSGQVQTHDGVWQSVTLIDGNVVGHTIARVQNDTCSKRERDLNKSAMTGW